MLPTLRYAMRQTTSRPLSTVAPKKVAVVLSGSGVYDGSECTEVVSILIHLSSAGYSASCYAPDKNQHHVVNHVTGEEMAEKRNVLIESARLARGNVAPLSDIDASLYDAIIVPGGFGAAKNLCNHATVCAKLAKLPCWHFFYHPLMLTGGAGRPCGIGSRARSCKGPQSLSGCQKAHCHVLHRPRHRRPRLSGQQGHSGRV